MSERREGEGDFGDFCSATFFFFFARASIDVDTTTNQTFDSSTFIFCFFFYASTSPPSAASGLGLGLGLSPLPPLKSPPNIRPKFHAPRPGAVSAGVAGVAGGVADIAFAFACSSFLLRALGAAGGVSSVGASIDVLSSAAAAAAGGFGGEDFNEDDDELVDPALIPTARLTCAHIAPSPPPPPVLSPSLPSPPPTSNSPLLPNRFASASDNMATASA